MSERSDGAIIGNIGIDDHTVVFDRYSISQP